MNVLSLFDGVSCGQVALERVGVKVNTYYASEIEPNPIKVTMKNYPNTIQLGDVTKWREWDIDWGNIDLLLGGSPCQGFSFAGKQLNFEDPRSKLFFEYADILNHIKKHNPDVKFLLENVKMKQEYQDVITEYLGVEPILIDSALVSAQNRKRLYWTNISNVVPPDDKGILIKDILENGKKFSYVEKTKLVNCNYRKNYLQYDIHSRGNNSQDQRAFYLYNKHGCLDTGCNSKSKILLENGLVRYTTIVEKERLQTLPDNYTNTISPSCASKSIGNGWTVDVIAHILSFLPDKFKIKEDE